MVILNDRYSPFWVLFVILLFTFPITGCQKYYYYVEQSQSETCRGTVLNIQERPYKDIPEEEVNMEMFGIYYPKLFIKAFSRRTAKKKAQKLFNERRRSAIDEIDNIITANLKKDLPSIPLYYELYGPVDKDHPNMRSYYLPAGLNNSQGSIRQDIIAMSSRRFDPHNLGCRWDDDNSNVYSGAKFGMSLNEVKNIKQFSTFVWDELDHSLTGSDSLGLGFYYIHLLFENERFYKIEFLSPKHTSTNSLPFLPFSERLSSNDDFRNLRRIFWIVYGKPSYYSAIPSLGKYTRAIYRWETSKKTILIASIDSCAFASIVDRDWIQSNNRIEQKERKQRELQQKRDEEKEALNKEERFNEDVSKFK